MTAITTSRISGKIMMIASEQLNFKVILMAWDKKNLTCSWPIKCINLVANKNQKNDQVNLALYLFLTNLINSIIHEHPCKILKFRKIFKYVAFTQKRPSYFFKKA